MDAFGWSTQYAAEPSLPSRPSDDGLLSAVMYTSFHDGLRPFDHGSLAMSSSQSIPNLVQCHDGTGLSDDSVPAGFMALDTAADMLPRFTGAVHDGLHLDAFAYVPNVAEVPAQATVSNSNTVFSGYSSTTGGNISSGESNTCCGGGQDFEVASPCAASRATLLRHQTPTLAPSSKRKLDTYPASCASATTATVRSAKRAAVSYSSSTSITFGGQNHSHHYQGSGTLHGTSGYEPDGEAMAQVKEMVYRAAAMRPVHQLVRAAADETKSSPRRNVRISSDPQTVAARLRRERVSERLRVLQRLVPGGTRMDTASMLDEAARYLRFLKAQLEALESAGTINPSNNGSGLLLQQNYAGNDLASGGGGGTGGGVGTVLAFGSRDGIGGYVKSNRNMPV